MSGASNGGGGQGVARRKKEKIGDDEDKKIDGQIPKWVVTFSEERQK